MIKFKTNLSFGFNLERNTQPKKEEEKTISKVFLAVKEIILKRRLKS